MKSKDLEARIAELELEFSTSRIKHFARIEALEYMVLELASKLNLKTEDVLKTLKEINLKSIEDSINRLPKELQSEHRDYLKTHLDDLEKNDQ